MKPPKRRLIAVSVTPEQKDRLEEMASQYNNQLVSPMIRTIVFHTIDNDEVMESLFGRKING